MFGGQFAQLFLQFQQRPIPIPVDVVFGGIDVGDAQDVGLQVLEVHQIATAALMCGQAS